MGKMAEVSPLSSSLIGDQQELARRVERLLEQPASSRKPEWAIQTLVAAAMGIPVLLAFAPLLWPDAMEGMFRLFERMLH